MTKAQRAEYDAVYNAVWDFHDSPPTTPDYAAHAKIADGLWQRVQSLDKSLGEGLKPGRLVSWGVADGHAHYLVRKVGKRDVVLDFLPLWDGYVFSGAYVNAKGDTIVPFPVVEAKIRASDWWRAGQKKAVDSAQKTS